MLYQEEEMDYAAADYEMGEVEDDLYDGGRIMGDTESDEEDDDDHDSLSEITDTSAAEARKGKDIQGIPWKKLSISRDKYRQTRIEQYKNYENVPQSGEGSEKQCKVTKKGGVYYEFWQNTRSVKSTILHFQKHPESLLEGLSQKGLSQTQVSTMSVRDNLLIAGGFQGELICKYLDRPGVSFCTRTTYEENAITNAIEIYDNQGEPPNIPEAESRKS
ncbi:transducin/WD40 repeat-like superfamily protein [Striga asiatica]|uniref:Transducin/WD40 repeat-like superfamily protein n=1 Tax=Striga asiatica TaxID=4170 RepID=A0A5A7PM98_STRAF|nr:transducin/WD40 repeat-like superfamily protein [Striga asiatica]